MDHSYWLKQSKGKPLFPEMLWSRPENRRFAGKLLIIGGNKHNFSESAEAYMHSVNAGVGSTRIILPDSLKKVVGALVPEAEFASSNPSGSFARNALATILDGAAWADGILVTSDIGYNSETAILIETLLQKFSGQITIYGTAIDAFLQSPKSLQNRPNTTILPTFKQLQTIITHTPDTTAITSTMDLMQLVEILHLHSSNFPYGVVLAYNSSLIATHDSAVSTLTSDKSTSTAKLAAFCATWWLQNPSKTFESLTTGVYETL